MPLLVWLDLETTGLDPRKDRVLEAAIAVADLSDPFNVEHVYQQEVYFPPHPTRCLYPMLQLVAAESWSRLDSFIVEMHTKNGLLEACGTVGKRIDQVEADMLRFVPWVEEKDDRPILAGSSIHFDHAFLKVHMPELARRLSHRHYDVSALKLAAQSMGMPRIKKAEAHRAKDDIDESVAHGKECLRWLGMNLNGEERGLR